MIIRQKQAIVIDSKFRIVLAGCGYAIVATGRRILRLHALKFVASAGGTLYITSTEAVV